MPPAVARRAPSGGVSFHGLRGNPRSFRSGALYSGRRMHLLDVTMLYAPTSGGVVRYLRAKRAWLRRHTSVRHSMLVPGDADGAGPAGERYLRTASLRPDGHRWPFAAHRWVREIRAAHPDL